MSLPPFCFRFSLLHNCFFFVSLLPRLCYWRQVKRTFSSQRHKNNNNQKETRFVNWIRRAISSVLNSSSVTCLICFSLLETRVSFGFRFVCSVQTCEWLEKSILFRLLLEWFYGVSLTSDWNARTSILLRYWRYNASQTNIPIHTFKHTVGFQGYYYCDVSSRQETCIGNVAFSSLITFPMIQYYRKKNDAKKIEAANWLQTQKDHHLSAKR